MLPKVPGIEKAATPTRIKANKKIMVVIRPMKAIIRISFVIPKFSIVSKTL